MGEAVETWVVVADGTAARVFEERVRLGHLIERHDLALVSHEDRHHASAHSGGGAEHSGKGDTRNASPAARAEHRFLATLAAQLDAAAKADAFRRLVIIAPPTALGVLRSALSDATQGRIEACDPHERRREDADVLRASLQRLRTTQ